MNLPLSRSVVHGALFLAAAGVVHLTHLYGEAQGRVQDADQVIFIPDGKALRHFTFNQQTTLADFYWLKLVQYLGGPEGTQPKILGLGQLITDLDPEYAYAYMASGLVLASKKRLGESNEILEKGAANAPWRWEIPFYLAFNYWYEIGDWDKGAYWLERAEKIPGRPNFLPLLVARLLASSGDMDAAIAFVKAMAEQAPNAKSREEYEHKLGQFALERDLQRLERAIAAFQGREGRTPWGLSELDAAVLSGLTLPVDGYGFNPVTGKVSCSQLEKRLKVNRPKGTDVQAKELRSP